MKWDGNRESDNVEDRRGRGGRGFGGRSISIGTIVIALLGSYFLGINPMTLLGLLSGEQTSVSQPAQRPPADDQTARFVSVVLADTEDVWGEIFNQNGASYVRPKLVLFSGSTPTACGTGETAAGPFYCPADQKVYLDLQFFQTMRERFHVSSDFAEAYVIAHEVGHHVQNLTGVMEKVAALRSRGSEKQANAMSVKVELQADCFAGVWAYHANQARNVLEGGDVESALKTASAIGDDTLQRQSRGTVVPDSFTHGTSAQRTRWFKRGLDSGSVKNCNTFSAQQL